MDKDNSQNQSSNLSPNTPPDSSPQNPQQVNVNQNAVNPNVASSYDSSAPLSSAKDSNHEEKKKKSFLSILLKIFAIAFLFLIIIFVIITLIWIFIPQVYYASLTRIMVPESKYQLAYTIPTQRDITFTDNNTNSDQVYTFFNITFNSPWQNVIDQKEKENIVKLQFEPESENNSIILSYQDYKISSEILNQQSEEDIDRIKQVFGEETLSSDYSLFSTMMYISPDQITLSTPPDEALSKSILSVMKATAAAHITDLSSTSDVYSFQTDSIRGFQFGTPNESTTVYLTFFDTDDNWFDMIITGENLQQQDIDSVILSVKQVSGNSVNDCQQLNEEQCRAESNCVPLGDSQNAYLSTGGEEESFMFTECADKVPQYQECTEVVKMTQMRGGSQYSKECRCCCGEGPSCNDSEYPIK